jgi:nicotinamide-nucleotide amidase
MFLRQALPAIKLHAKIKTEAFLTRTLKVSGLSEAAVADKVKGLLKLKPPLTLGIYAKPAEVELRIMAKSSSPSDVRRMIQSIEKIIRKKLTDKIFGSADDTLADAVGALLRDKKKTLAIAESCTGGQCSSLVTDISGSSDYFLGGLVAYDNRIKMDELGVSKMLLAKKGAVSPEVACVMAKGARSKFKSDYALGITGIAGPGGGSRKKPVGLVYIAVAGPKNIICRKNLFVGNRREIKYRAAHTALDLLRLRLLKGN